MTCATCARGTPWVTQTDHDTGFVRCEFLPKWQARAGRMECALAPSRWIRRQDAEPTRAADWWVNLMSKQESNEAFAHGVERFEASRARGYQHSHAYAPTLEEGRFNAGMSMCAERQVAIMLGREWLAISRPIDQPDNGFDVPPNLQVRWTSLRDGRLIVKHDDDDVINGTAVISVLVRGGFEMLPRLDLAGWIYVRDAKREEFWERNVRTPGWFVPAANLVQFEDRVPPKP